MFRGRNLSLPDFSESMLPLFRDFSSRHIVDVARSLLGKVLVRVVNDGVMAGFIVEVEGSDDSVSHA